MPRKVYQLKHFLQLETSTVVDGKKVAIKFSGESLFPRVPGRFEATDPKLIAAMDADMKRAGSDCAYRCILSEGDPKAKDFDPNEPPEDPPVGNEDFTKAEEVKTLQEAKEYLVKNVEGMTASRIPNKQAVLNAAKENKIEFPNLQ